MAVWQIEKRNGNLQSFDRKKIYRSILSAQRNIDMVDKDLAKDLALWVWRDLKENFKSEIVITTVEIGDTVERILIEESLYDIAKAYIIAREKQRQKAKADRGLGVKDDLGLSYNQLLVMSSKYLKRDDNDNIIETPKQMFERVAEALARPEKMTPKAWEKKFYKVMTEFRFLPGGRTLANAGTINNQLANCFVLPMPDSVDGVFQVVKESSILKKNGGGVGFSFGKIRPKGDKVATTTGKACGPVAIMHIINKASDMLLQAGGRRSGNMVVLPVSHPDIFEFLTCKEEETTLNHINFSIGVTSKFMKAVEKDDSWDLVNPRNGEVVNTVDARSIFDLAVTMAWKNGDPGIIFLDEINKYNPTPQVGPIESVNLCGEQPLLPYEACNLGSINLAKHLAIKSKVKKDPTQPDSSHESQTSLDDKTGLKSLPVLSNRRKREYEVDWVKLKETVEISVRALDNVVSICTYPLKKVTETVNANRKIGLGVMGWADMLTKMQISYRSQESCKLAEEIAKFITQTGKEYSQKLAVEKGVFPNWKGSRLQLNGEKPMRNATITTIAPTGSIAMIAGCSYGIEPHFALAYYKQALGGYKLPEINEDLIDALNEHGFDSSKIIDEIMEEGTIQYMENIPGKIKEIFVTAHDLSYGDHIKMQAAWQKYTDNAVSKTINLSNDATVDDVEKAYMMAWKEKCKGITVYRDSSRSEQVLNLGNGRKKVKTHKKVEIKKELKNKIKNLKKSERCPMCGGKLQIHEGCKSCSGCGFSACSI